MKADQENIPQHIAIIMDGNGRWAKQHTVGRISGHRKGAQAVKITVSSCREIGIKYLTLFAFSVENWQRPGREVKALMLLLEKYLNKETKELHKQGIKLTTIGDIEHLNQSVQEKLALAKALTANNDKMTLNLALSYGGRDEIISAVKKVIHDNKNNLLKAEDINSATFSNYLQTSGIPDPDLLIRTSGEYRLSNFLLWQLAYTELYFTEVFWPDFNKRELLKAIASYQKRERRFGLTSEQLKRNSSGKS